MADNFPMWSRSVAPEGTLVLPAGDHSLLDAFGSVLDKVGGFIEDHRDWLTDDDADRVDQTPADSASPGRAPPETLQYNQSRREQYAASNSAIGLANAASAQLAQLRADAAPGAPGFTEQAAASFDQLADRTLADTPPPMKRYMAAQVDALRQAHLVDAARVEVQARNDWDRETAQSMLDNASAQVTADPGKFDFALANLGQAIKASDLSPEQQEALFGQVKDHLGYAAMTSIVDRDPDDARRMIESGAADKYMAGDERDAWLQKVADHQDQQRLDEVKTWTQAENAAPGLHLGMRETAKQELLQQLARGTLSQDAIDGWKDVLGPELTADFGALVGHHASATSDSSTLGALLMGAGDHDLWPEAVNAAVQGRVSPADFSRIIATNQRLLQTDAAGTAYSAARQGLVQQVLQPSGLYATTPETITRALWLFDGWVASHPDASLQDLTDQAKKIGQVVQGEQPVPSFTAPVTGPGHRVFPADFVGPILPQDSYSLIPMHPPGADVDANMTEAKSMFPNPFVFRDAVTDYGRWDYKQQSEQYENFGNFNYGAAGHAWGFPDEVLLKMAGKQQIKDNRSKPEWQSGGDNLPPYGDDLKDQRWIQRGIDYAKSREKAKGSGK
jgi:hypothetical protein